MMCNISGMQIHDGASSFMVCWSQAVGQCIVEAVPGCSSASRSGSTVVVIVLFRQCHVTSAKLLAFIPLIKLFILIINTATGILSDGT